MGRRVATILGGLAICGALGVSLGAAAMAAEGERPRERLLSVIGEGVVRARPDMAIITLGVVSEAKEARAALMQNTAAMSRLTAALKGKAIESRDLQTSGFSVEPRYSQPPRDQDPNEAFAPEIVGYTVRNQLVVRIRDLARTGDILDSAVTLGANSISGPDFTVADPSAQEDLARRAAMRDALRKSALYAEAAGVTLGPIARIEEGSAPQPRGVPMQAMAREVAADSAVPVEGGELSTQIQVSVSWKLAD